MADPATPLDSDWLRAHPLPQPEPGTDKNGRGRVLAVGGCAQVPGGLLLTAEGALRAGAGKVQIATVRSAALAIGMAMPEVRVIAQDEGADGEILALGQSALDTLGKCDAAIVGPAMICEEAAGRAIDAILDAKCTATIVIDAAALMSLPSRASRLRKRERPVVLTPHIGEIAALLECGADEIERDRIGGVLRAAEHFGAVVVLKGETSLIADREGRLLSFAGGGVGLATGGSGDVQAGIAAGLAARGAEPLVAAAWAVWLHGEAGRRCAEQIGPLGFLARELLAHVPSLMRGV